MWKWPVLGRRPSAAASQQEMGIVLKLPRLDDEQRGGGGEAGVEMEAAIAESPNVRDVRFVIWKRNLHAEGRACCSPDQNWIFG